VGRFVPVVPGRHHWVGQVFSPVPVQRGSVADWDRSVEPVFRLRVAPQRVVRRLVAVVAPVEEAPQLVAAVSPAEVALRLEGPVGLIHPLVELDVPVEAGGWATLDLAATQAVVAKAVAAHPREWVGYPQSLARLSVASYPRGCSRQ
jgi:hypothetical protein